MNEDTAYYEANAIAIYKQVLTEAMHSLIDEHDQAEEALRDIGRYLLEKLAEIEEITR